MDLQLALLLVGALLITVVALTAYDKRQMLDWLTRYLQTGRREAAGSPDPLLDINPGPPDEQRSRFLRPAPTSTPPPRTPLEHELEGLAQAAALPIDTALPAGLDIDHVLPRDRATMPDAAIDFIMVLPGNLPVARDLALGVYKQHEYVLEKPRRLYGMRHPIGPWVELDKEPDTGEYGDLALAIQLVDRQGALSESELNAFVQVGLKLADALHRHTRLSMPFEQALVGAAELHRFCEQYDVLASVNITSNHLEGFRGRLVEQVAMRQGMEFGAMNIFHMKNNYSVGCRHLFSMANLFAPGVFDLSALDGFRTHGLTFFMAVPCVERPRETFDKMVGTAKGFCRMLGGKMLDHDRRPLSEQGLTLIRGQIDQIAAEMRERGIVPGSPAALRLFSHE